MALNCKLALSTNSKKINEELFRSFSTAGIEATEISVSSNEYENLDFCNILRLSKKYNIKLWSFHLPFSPFNIIDISNPDVAQHTVDLFKTYIKKANDIGIKIFVLHPSGEPIKDADRKNRMQCAKKSLKELAEYANGLKCVIAVENLPRSCLGNNSKEILELISVHNNLCVCCDTNHLLNEDIVDFIHNVGNRIVTVHISDCDFINERHWLPGEGKIDWSSVVKAFGDIGYDKYWLYEVEYAPPWSIERDRNLNCTDFKNNFTELVQGKELTKIGRPKNNLEMWNIAL